MTIASQIERIETAKQNIKSAIQAKGVTVPSNALISDYANYISQISTGSGGESVPRLPDRLVVSKDMKSTYNPVYIGTYVKQGTPADWTDTYYCKPSIEQYGTSYDICCIVGEGSGGETQYSWIITTISPENQIGENVITGKLINSVISEVPVAPQDIRWEVDTGGDDQTFIIVEEDGNSGGGDSGGGSTDSITVLFDNNSNEIFSGEYAWNSSANRYQMQTESNGDTVICTITQRTGYWELERSDVIGNEIKYTTSGGVDSIIGTHEWSGQGAFYSGTYTITIAYA